MKLPLNITPPLTSTIELYGKLRFNRTKNIYHWSNGIASLDTFYLYITSAWWKSSKCFNKFIMHFLKQISFRLESRDVIKYWILNKKVKKINKRICSYFWVLPHLFFFIILHICFKRTQIKKKPLLLGNPIFLRTSSIYTYIYN